MVITPEFNDVLTWNLSHASNMLLTCSTTKYTRQSPQQNTYDNKLQHYIQIFEKFKNESWILHNENDPVHNAQCTYTHVSCPPLCVSKRVQKEWTPQKAEMVDAHCSYVYDPFVCIFDTQNGGQDVHQWSPKRPRQVHLQITIPEYKGELPSFSVAFLSFKPKE